MDYKTGVRGYMVKEKDNELYSSVMDILICANEAKNIGRDAIMVNK